MSVVIRSLAVSDRPHWERLFAGYAEFYKTTIPSGGMDTVWSWIFDPENDFWCDVARNAHDQIVGFAHYHLQPRPISGGMICFLSDLYVEPASRGSGAGRALIDQITRFAKDGELPQVRWLTQEFNYTARSLYDTYTPKSDFILYSVDC
jgi:GNAT superfamily N-acetyltransferase